MKNIAFTIARFVFPFEFEAVSDKSGDMTAVMQEAYSKSKVSKCDRRS